MQERTRRILMTICGVLVCGFSVGMFNFSALGLDPFQVFTHGIFMILPAGAPGFGTVYAAINLLMPRYVVFYNGLDRREETFTQNLSESFAGDEGCIEVAVRTYNINYGHNGELLEKCPTLNGYAKFVSMVRENLEMMELPKAVEHAVTECIRQDILKDFLVAQRNEVVAMSIYEYNEEYAMRVTYEDGETAGYMRGKKEGKEEGRGQNLIHNIEAVMKNFGISLEKACAGLDVTVEEYQRVKAQNVRTD